LKPEHINTAIESILRGHNEPDKNGTVRERLFVSEVNVEIFKHGHVRLTCAGETIDIEAVEFRELVWIWNKLHGENEPVTEQGNVTRVTFRNGTQLAWDSDTGRAIIKRGGQTLETITPEEWKRLREAIKEEGK
jgi:hypothetical protein